MSSCFSLHHLRSSAFICGFILFIFACGCDRSERSDEIVLYTSIDQPIAAPIIREFEESSGIRVRLVTDTEASKSVGLAERLRAERDNPQADVWWGNEPFHTIALADEGLLEPYSSPAATDVPEKFKDPQVRWASVGMRVRVIAVSEPPGDVAVSGIEDLKNPALRGKIALARPTAGTTGGHVAALYFLWGDQKADEYFRALHANGIKLLGGNAIVAEAAGTGTVLAGLTDNDDVAAAVREGGKLSQVIPDQQSFGTLAVPTTVAIVAGTDNQAAAAKLVDYLLSRQAEQRMIDAEFVAYSVRDAEGEDAKVRTMSIDYPAVAKLLPTAVRRATAILEGREP